MSETEQTQPPASESQASQESKPALELNPVTKKIVEKCIQEVLSEYVQQTKMFTADSIHYIRTKVTDLAKQRIGADDIISIDVGLDLTKSEEVPFFFKVNIPLEKTKDHLIEPQLNKEESPVNTSDKESQSSQK